jgi:acyl CoA:acetate/3-ketoacid CoA transferase alpha subunit
MRAGGAGIPGFYTKTGVGTLVAQGKEVKIFGGEEYILEHGIFADLSIIKAWKADESGNLVFRKTARNFNLPAATCGKVCVVEVEEVVPVLQGTEVNTINDLCVFYRVMNIDSNKKDNHGTTSDCRITCKM